MPERTHCGQKGCSAEVVWGKTVRQLDEKTGKMTGGRPMMVDWPFPVLRMKADQLVAGEDGQPVPNLGTRQDQWGTLLVRVLSETEPLRPGERPAIPHWATCKNPPPPKRRRAKVTASNNQTEMHLDMPSADPLPGPLSDQRLFPHRRSRRG